MKHNYCKRPFYSVKRLVRGMFIVAVDKKLQLAMITYQGWVAGFRLVCLFSVLLPVGTTSCT